MNIYRFLFRKDSAAYQQYRQLVQQFKHEKELKRKIEENQENDCKPKPEDIYEPETAFEDDTIKTEIKDEVKVRFFHDILHTIYFSRFSVYSELENNIFCRENVNFKG